MQPSRGLGTTIGGNPLDVGVRRDDDCTPSCAEGTFTSHPTRLHAYAPRFCKAASRIVYSRLTISGLHVGGQAVIPINHDCRS